MEKITDKDADFKDIPSKSILSNYEEYVKVFMASNLRCRELNVPNGLKAWSMYSSLARVRKKLNLVGKLGIRVVDCKRVFVYKL